MKSLAIDHLPLISSAPDGVKRLRELILQLAVMGKLVPQDPNDEPASVLLKTITEFKEKRERNGRHREPKVSSTNGINGEFKWLPPSWEQPAIQDVFDVRDGTHDSPRYQSKGFPLVTSKNLYSGVLDLKEVNLISEADFLKISERSGVSKGDVLFAMIGSIGNPVLVDTDVKFAIKNVALFKLYFEESSSMRFLQIFLRAKSEEMKKSSSGGVQTFISLSRLRSYLIPLPPLAEQHRIVAKVDELMALCDKLEAQQNDSEAAHSLLVKTLLDTLTQTQDAADFAASWARIKENFHTLFTTEESVDILKQTLLQLAVMGKLVPQDPNDEKSRWPKYRLEEVAEARLGKMLDKQKNVGVATPYLRNINVRWFDFDLSDLREMKVKHSELDEITVQCGDVLICEGGEPGRCAVWNREDRMVFQKAIHRVRVDKEKLFPTWLVYCIRAASNSGELEALFTGSTIKHLTGVKLGKFELPIPSKTEQEETIRELENLLSTCDRLRNTINLARHQLDVVSKVLAAPPSNVMPEEPISILSRRPEQTKHAMLS